MSSSIKWDWNTLLTEYEEFTKSPEYPDYKKREDEFFKRYDAEFRATLKGEKTMLNSKYKVVINYDDHSSITEFFDTKETALEYAKQEKYLTHETLNHASIEVFDNQAQELLLREEN